MMHKVKEFCEQIRGVSYSPKNISDKLTENSITLLRATNIQDGLLLEDLVYINREIITEKQMLRKGDILICASSGSKHLVGKAVSITENLDMTFGAFCKVVRPKNINAKYLGQYFQSPLYRRLISGSSAGANINNIKNEDIDNLTIKVPPLPEQQRIANELDTICGVLAKQKEQYKLLDELIKSKFNEMFGDPVLNDKGWDVQKLEYCTDFYNGKAHEQVIDNNGKYILVTSRCVSTNFNDYRRTNKALFPLFVNDIVMVMSDVPNGKAIAKCYLINENDKYTLNQRICCFRDYNFSPIFLYYYLNRHPYFLSFDDGNAQTNLKKDEILFCDVQIPPSSLQQQFADFVNQVEQSKEKLKAEMEQTETLYKALMQKYFG